MSKVLFSKVASMFQDYEYHRLDQMILNSSPLLLYRLRTLLLDTVEGWLAAFKV